MSSNALSSYLMDTRSVYRVRRLSGGNGLGTRLRAGLSSPISFAKSSRGSSVPDISRDAAHSFRDHAAGDGSMQ